MPGCIERCGRAWETGTGELVCRPPRIHGRRPRSAAIRWRRTHIRVVVVLEWPTSTGRGHCARRDRRRSKQVRAGVLSLELVPQWRTRRRNWAPAISVGRLQLSPSRPGRRRPAEPLRRDARRADVVAGRRTVRRTGPPGGTDAERLSAGTSATAHAGCAIVEGSDPDDEYDQTRIMMRQMLEALGLRRRAGGAMNAAACQRLWAQIGQALDCEVGT
jgi:hypothetical protein